MEEINGQRPDGGRARHIAFIQVAPWQRRLVQLAETDSGDAGLKSLTGHCRCVTARTTTWTASKTVGAYESFAQPNTPYKTLK